MNFEMFTVAEAAEKARISHRLLNDKIKEGCGPAVTQIGAARRIRSDLFEAWLRERTVQSARPVAEAASA